MRLSGYDSLPVIPRAFDVMRRAELDPRDFDLAHRATQHHRADAHVPEHGRSRRDVNRRMNVGHCRLTIFNLQSKI
jgi:hypothetical protein